MFHDILEHARIELVDDLLSDARGEHEVGVSQDGEMPGDGWPGRVEVLGNLPGRAGAVLQQAEDVAPGGVGKGLECAVHD